MIGVRVTPEIKKRVEEKAKKEGITPSQWIRKLILENLEKPTQIEQIIMKMEEIEKRLEKLETRMDKGGK